MKKFTYWTPMIAMLVLTGILGLWLLVHVKSGQQPPCNNVSIENINLINLI